LGQPRARSPPTPPSSFFLRGVGGGLARAHWHGQAGSAGRVGSHAVSQSALPCITSAADAAAWRWRLQVAGALRSQPAETVHSPPQQSACQLGNPASTPPPPVTAGGIARRATCTGTPQACARGRSQWEPACLDTAGCESRSSSWAAPRAAASRGAARMRAVSCL
jgi:hypothetical protein